MRAGRRFDISHSVRQLLMMVVVVVELWYTERVGELSEIYVQQYIENTRPDCTGIFNEGVQIPSKDPGKCLC